MALLTLLEHPCGTDLGENCDMLFADIWLVIVWLNSPAKAKYTQRPLIRTGAPD